MNSAGLEAANPISTFILPSKTSCGVTVLPRPTFTKNAWAALAPTNPPAFQMPVKKLSICAFTRIWVLASLA